MQLTQKHLPFWHLSIFWVAVSAEVEHQVEHIQALNVEDWEA
jgi:hypothetical protein